ncbi:MAG: endonuclease NucS [Sulfolobales archaeon]
MLTNVEWGMLQELLKKNYKLNTILLVGSCEVMYEGRASSRASEARRLIIIKEDGSIYTENEVIEIINHFLKEEGNFLYVISEIKSKLQLIEFKFRN